MTLNLFRKTQIAYSKLRSSLDYVEWKLSQLTSIFYAFVAFLIASFWKFIDYLFLIQTFDIAIRFILISFLFSFFMLILISYKIFTSKQDEYKLISNINDIRDNLSYIDSLQKETEKQKSEILSKEAKIKELRHSLSSKSK